MQLIKLLMVASLLLMMRTGFAQQDDQHNAAYWYQRAIEKLETLSEDDRDTIVNYMYGEVPAPELRGALQRAEPVLALVQRGAAQQYSDFGLDLSQGIGLMLPHLGQLRQCTKMMATAAYVKMHDGDGMGAARELGSLYNLGQHMSDDRIIISSLVGQAIFMHSDRAVQDGIDRGTFDAAASAELYKAIERFDVKDPFGYVEDMFGEQELMISTLEQYFNIPDLTKDTVQKLVGESTHAEAAFEEIKQEGLDSAIEKIDAVMNEVTEIFMIDDESEANKRITEFELKVEAGEFGAMALLLMPAYSKIHERLLMARTQIADRRAMLEQLAKGELDPKDTLNAALIYQQAIDAWYATDASKQAAMLAILAEPTQTIPDDVKTMMVESQPIVDLIRQASQLKRCDFEKLRRIEKLTIAPAYVIGMHELLGLLQTDALRLMQDKNSADAADRLAIGYRAIGHLSGDDQLLSALVAHHAFDGLTLQMRNGLSAGLSDEQRGGLFNAIDRINRRDPFGYVNAVMATRKQVERPLRHHSAVYARQDGDEIDVMISDWQGEQLLYVLTMIETVRGIDPKAGNALNIARAPRANDEEMYKPILIDRLRPVNGVISIEAVQTAQNGVAEVAALLAEGKLDIVKGREIPSIGSWNDRMRHARGDLREARRLVKVDEIDDKDAEAPAE